MFFRKFIPHPTSLSVGQLVLIPYKEGAQDVDYLGKIKAVTARKIKVFFYKDETTENIQRKTVKGLIVSSWDGEGQVPVEVIDFVKSL